MFIAQYLTRILQRPSDLRNTKLLDLIYMLAQSKFAIMDGKGHIATVGRFVNEDGLLYSNLSYIPTYTDLPF